MQLKNRTSTFFLVICALASGTSSAFDQWQINEVFSSSDGRVQYIELYTSESGQGGWQGLTLFARNQSNGEATAPERSLVLATGMTGDTAGKTVLLATQRFVERTGLIPDFYIPESFLPLDGGILYLGNVDNLEIDREDFPLNGTQSIDGDGNPQTASPQNYSGQGSGVAIAPAATADFSAGILNVPVVDVPGLGVANLSFDINLQTLEFTLRDDFYLYGEGIDAGAHPSSFQNNSSLYIPNLVVGNEFIELRLLLLNADPVVFGNIDVIEVGPVLADTNADPEPNWVVWETFSNVDGTLQFIELFTSSSEEQNLAGVSLEVARNFGNEKQTFTFPEDLSGSTKNKSILLATAAFEDETGVAPDYIIPDSFLPAGTVTTISLELNGGTDRIRLPGNINPINGFQSLNRLGGPGIASPTNLAGETGTVNAESFAIFNPADNTIFLPEVDRGEQGMQATLFEVDVENVLFRFRSGWPLRSGILPSDDSAIFTAGQGLTQYYVPRLLIADKFYEITFEWINELNAYGNLQVLSVTDR